MGNKIIKKWNMLDSYSEGQAIYGRDTEISSIKESILYNIQTFIYGKSGIGKTSLLQAGVFPQLRQVNYFPVVIRLSFYNNESLNHTIKRLIEEEAEREDLTINKIRLHHYVIDDTEVLDCSLYEYFAKVRFEDNTHTPYIPVLVLDQFEETINNEEQWQRTVDFLKEDLYDLMDNSNIIHGDCNSYTNYRIVFSMREDYLYCLEDIVDRYSLWELRYNRYRIKALNDKQASDVIRLTSGTDGLERGKEDKIVKLIIKIVKNNSGSRFTEINTALLSIICSLLYENSIDKCIYYCDLRKINVYLNSYYDTICDEIGWTAANYLENKLLTKDGRRSSIDEVEAIQSNKVNKKQLDYLVEKRFLRRIKTDSTSIRYEYIHDLFARMIFKRRMDRFKKWYYPELSSISRKLNRNLFIKKILLTTIIGSLLIFVAYVVTLHPVFESLITLTIYLLVLITYLLPLVVKRLHDIGRSGWWITICGLFPTIYTLLLRNGLFNFPKGIWNEYIALVGSFICFSFIGWLCIRPSVPVANQAKYSKEYEAMFKGSLIDNVQFAKSFLLELSIWIVNYCFVKMVHIIIAYRDYLNLDFSINYNDFLILKWFDSDLSVPAVLGMLPFVLCFSPSFKTRTKTIGYPIILAYIPYLNIILLFVELLPNQLLHTLKLWREPKIRNESSEDDVVVEIHDSLFSKIGKSTTKEKYGIKVLFMLFIPFYSIISFWNHKLSIRQRITAYSLNAWSGLLLLCIGILGMFNSYIDIVGVLWGILTIVALIQCYLLRYCSNKYNNLINTYIINEIRINPHYDIDNEENGSIIYNDIKKQITKLSKNGYIKRVVSNENIHWEIDTERCAKFLNYD